MLDLSMSMMPVAIGSSEKNERRFLAFVKALGFATALLWSASVHAEVTKVHVDGLLARGLDVPRQPMTDFVVNFHLDEARWALADYAFVVRDAARLSFDADLFLFDPPPKTTIVSVIGYDRNTWDLTGVIFEGEANWVLGTKLTIHVHRPDLRRQIERRLSGAFEQVQSSRDAVTSYINQFLAEWNQRGYAAASLQRGVEAGDTYDQFRLAQSYERSGYFYALAYKWYAIVAKMTANGAFDHKPDPELATDAAAGRDRVAAHMTPDQLADTKKLVESWRPDLSVHHGSFWVRQKNGVWTRPYTYSFSGATF